MAAGGSIDALGQFKLEPALGAIGASVNFTQANLMMVVAGLLTFGLLWVGMRPRAMVPGRLQSAAEMAYETVLGMCTETIGPEGRAYFPFVFTLFFFILFGNLLGVFPLLLHLHQPHRGDAGADGVRGRPGDRSSRSASMAGISSATSCRRACRWR